MLQRKFQKVDQAQPTSWFYSYFSGAFTFSNVRCFWLNLIFKKSLFYQKGKEQNGNSGGRIHQIITPAIVESDREERSNVEDTRKVDEFGEGGWIGKFKVRMHLAFVFFKIREDLEGSDTRYWGGHRVERFNPASEGNRAIYIGR